MRNGNLLPEFYYKFRSFPLPKLPISSDLPVFKLVIFSAFFLIQSNLKSQNSYQPQFYDQLWQTFLQINPGQTGFKGPLEINTGSRLTPGVFSLLRSYYASGGFRLKDTLKGSNFGVFMAGQSEGLLFHKNEAQLMYAYRLLLSNQHTLAAGASVGFKNFFIESTDISAGGSSWAPTANLGLWLTSVQWQLGVSLNQLPGGSLRPMQEGFRLERFGTIYGSCNIDVNPYFRIKPFAFVAGPINKTLFIQTGLLSELNDFFTAGLNYRYQESLSIVMGLNSIPIATNQLAIYFSYSFPAGTRFRGLNILELSLSYFSI